MTTVKPEALFLSSERTIGAKRLTKLADKPFVSSKFLAPGNTPPAAEWLRGQ